MMKKFFSKSWLKAACVAVLGLMSVNATAETVVFDFNNGDNLLSCTKGTVHVSASSSEWFNYSSWGMGYYCGNGTHGVTVSSSDNIQSIIIDNSSYCYGKYYNVEITSGSGTVSTNSDKNVATLTIDPGCTSVTFTITGSGSNINVLTVETEDADPSLTYSVSLLDVEHGTISASATTEVHAKDIITLTATPDAGYSLESWTVINTKTSESIVVTDDKFQMPASDVTVSATFVKYHTVNLASVTNGTISASKTAKVKEGDLITLYANPNFGFLIDGWTVINDETSAIISVVANQFTMPDANVTVSASFTEMEKYNITIDNSIANGSISASATTNIYPGTVITLTPNPADGYHLESLSVTNASTSANISVSNYQFTMPEADVIISATFDIYTDSYANTISSKSLFDQLTVINANNDVQYWDGSPITWEFYEGQARISYNSGEAMDDYLVTPAIAITGGQYRLSIDMREQSTSYPERFEVVYGTVASVDGLNNCIISAQEPTVSYQTYTVDFTIDTPGSYFFAIHGISDANMYYLYAKNFVLEQTAPLELSAEISVAAAGYTSYYNSAKAYTMPAGLTGYVVTPALQLAAEYEAGDVVPAGEPLVLQGAAGDYELVYAESSEWPLKSSLENLLDGTDAEQTTSVSLYSLYNGGSDAANCYFFGLTLNAASELNSAGFYYMNATGAAFTNGAHKAYLCLPKTMLDGVAAGQFRGWSFAEMENGLETAISLTPSLSEGEGACYDLYGRRTNGKGVLLQNGKVVLVK